MIFNWKKTEKKTRAAKEWGELFCKLRFFPSSEEPLIQFHDVCLSTTIENLNIEIPPGSWVLLQGEDDFAKALFCDLCFGYIFPEAGLVSPGLKASDVSFIGRSNTTYGNSLLEQLSCGVQETAKELLEFVAKNVLSPRFRRHLSPSLLAFSHNKKAAEMELDERDLLEIAEANVLLQKRKAAVIDTTSDFYQIALEQGFQHSDIFLRSGKTLLWIVSDIPPQTPTPMPWADAKYRDIKCSSLYFPNGSRATHIN